MDSSTTPIKIQASIDFEKQAIRLGHQHPDHNDEKGESSEAVQAQFITGQDPVIETANGGRLPAVPVQEAIKLNDLKAQAEGREPDAKSRLKLAMRTAKDGTVHGAGAQPLHEVSEKPSANAEGSSLRDSIPPVSTDPLFPALPTYGPPSLLRSLQFYTFRVTSAVLSLCFLLVIILGSAFTSIPLMLEHIWIRSQCKNPDERRAFYKDEVSRQNARHEARLAWAKKERQKEQSTMNSSECGEQGDEEDFAPLEGGPDPLICDLRYYARRVGLEVETFEVQTEDGFIIELFHVYDPREYYAASPEDRQHGNAEVYWDEHAHCKKRGNIARQYEDGSRKYPVLLMHGLLQSPGAYCCTDDDSLAFFLAKSGYDVWLGANRCGFTPKHNLLQYSDPRMWAWNIRQMGVMDLPALISRVLCETGFEKLGLVCHSQGTTQTFVALAKEQRPDIGNKISVFCALAPAAYAGPLIKKMYFKFMRIISPGMFRIFFGIHAFIPIMMTMHSVLPARFYGAMGYRVFAFLFDWTDDKWDRELRNRMFQFSPVYVSSESMRWWLGRECFAKHKCILATKEEGRLEDEEDQEEEDYFKAEPSARDQSDIECHSKNHHHKDHERFAWYDEQAPPFALWVAGNDDLVDGRRLLRRFERGREPHVKVVHSKIIEGYEHLDVIWAMDSIEQVGKEVREVIWKTMPDDARATCRIPAGCSKE